MLLLPIFISSQWGQTYNGNFLAAYFTVRARSLLAFLAAVVAMVINMLTGWFLDNEKYRRSVKARCSWMLIAFLFTAMWGVSISLQRKLSTHPIDLDWNTPGFGRAALSYLFFRQVRISQPYWHISYKEQDCVRNHQCMGVLDSRHI